LNPNLDVDNLMGYMPSAVLEEYRLHGDAGIIGFSPLVKQWLKTSQHPRIVRWRDDLKRHTSRQLAVALRRQERMCDLAKDAYANSTRGMIRHKAVIDPVIKGWMETKYGNGVWKEKEPVADTKRIHPKLFIN
jgi:hypothetical protein